MVGGTGPLRLDRHLTPPTIGPKEAPSANPAPKAEQSSPTLNKESSYHGPAIDKGNNPEPVGIQFQALTRPPILDDLQALNKVVKTTESNNPDHLHPVQDSKKNQLEKTAKALGFANLKSLQFSLRNLPSGRVPQVLSRLEKEVAALPPSQRTAETIKNMAQTTLNTQVQAELNTLFKKAGVPTPKFEPNPWPLQGSLAVYNAFSEINQSQGLNMFKHVGQHEGKPLTFKLDNNQVSFSENSASAMQDLTSAMMIAQSEHETGSVRIHPAALTMNPEDVLSHPPIKALLQGLENKDPQAIRSMQNLLNYSRPERRAIKPNGRLDLKTQNAVKEFQYLQILQNIEDAVGDDMELPSKDVTRFRNHVANIRGAIQDHGHSHTTVHQFTGLINRIANDDQTSDTIKNRLNTIKEQLPHLTDGQFDKSTMEGMIKNWFGMIDGGEQLSFSEQVITHELGHILQNESEILQNWRQISWGGEAAHEHNHATIMGETLKPDGHEGFVSDYAQVNDQEDFAESYRMFTHQPERLLKSDLMKFMLLASITDKYKGKESEMLELIQSSGYDNTDLERAVLKLRGQLEAASRDNIDDIASTTVDWTKKLSPLVGLVLEKADGYFDLRDKVANWWTDLRGYQNGPEFTPKMASSLSDIDELMGIETAHLESTPQQKGFVLDFLSRNQAVLSNFDSSSADKQKARDNLTHFAKKGLAIFPDSLQAEIPADIKEKFSGPQAKEERAIALSLAYILGRSKAREDSSGEGEQSLTDKFASFFVKSNPKLPIHDKGFHMNSLIQDIKRNPNLLRNAVGRQTFSQLPESFLTLLTEPQFLDSLTDKKTTISANFVQTYINQEVDKRSQHTHESTLGSAIESLSKLFKGKYTKKAAYAKYTKTVEEFNRGVRDKAPVLSRTDFEKAITSALEKQKLREEPLMSPSFSLETLDPFMEEMLDEGGNDLDIFLNELQIQPPGTHSFGGIEATG